MSPESVSAKTSGNIKNSISAKSGDQGGSETQISQTQISQETMIEIQNTVKPHTSSQNNTPLGYENFNGPGSKSSCILETEQILECSLEMESNRECGNEISCTLENEAQLHNIPEPVSFE